MNVVKLVPRKQLFCCRKKVRKKAYQDEYVSCSNVRSQSLELNMWSQSSHGQEDGSILKEDIFNNGQKLAIRMMVSGLRVLSKYDNY